MTVTPLAPGPHFDHRVVHHDKGLDDPGDTGEPLSARNGRVTFQHFSLAHSGFEVEKGLKGGGRQFIYFL